MAVHYVIQNIINISSSYPGHGTTICSTFLTNDSH